MPRRKQPSRPKAPKGTAPNQRIEFSYHPHLNTPEGETYRYLLRNPLWTAEQGKSMANESILTRFLPYARQQEQPEVARAIAQHCVRQLLRYIDELCRDFGLDNPINSASGQSNAPIQPIQSVPVIIPSQNVTPASSKGEETEVEYAQFDVFE